MSLAAPRDAFLEHLRAERRLSPHTVTAYTRDTAHLLEHLGAEGIDDWRDVRTEHLRAALAARRRGGLGVRSAAREQAAVRGLFRYLLEHGHVHHNPAEPLRSPKTPKKLPEVLDTDSAGALMRKLDDSPLARRDLAMVELFYSSGLRLAELVGLDLDALALQADGAGEVRVTGKGSKTRIVPVGRAAGAAMRAWLEVRGGLAEEGECAVFVSTRGTRISRRAVQDRVARQALATGADARVHPHMLRHAFASHLLESSGNLRAVQELLGHASLASTQVYTHLDFQHLSRIYDQTHPRAERRRERKD